LDRTDSLPRNSLLQEDSFDFIKPEEFESLGIDPSDIPPGTFPSRKHPSNLPSRFGGNAYGFGFFELYAYLNARDLRLLQSITPGIPELSKPHYEEINRIYKNMGLLIRFSSQGKPYYLIPNRLIFSSLSTIKSRADETSKIVLFHRKKYLKESYKIGVITHTDDLIINELSLRFKEHQFIVLDSLEKLLSSKETLDLVILNRDIYEIAIMEKFSSLFAGSMTRRQLENQALYILAKIYNLLKPDGEIFMIATHFALETREKIKVTFLSEQEKKNFVLFGHIFKTKEKPLLKGMTLQVNRFDFQKYLNPPYVEKEVLDKLLGGRNPESMTPDDIQDLPFLGFSLHGGLAYDQEEVWERLLSVCFKKIFLKPLLPETVKEEWQRRFTTRSYTPQYLLIYLGQKRPLQTTLGDLRRDVMESKLPGCPLSLVADYRDSFDYVIATLGVVKKIKAGGYDSLPELYMERLKEPLENKKRRHGGLNHVLKLVAKTHRFEKLKDVLNPESIEGVRTPVLKNLETLSLFGFPYGELKEIFLIVVGHTPMGRILSGKMNEKSLKPFSDLARTYELHQALNLLRYCRLMSVSETAASKKTDLNQEELAELFDLYESIVRVVTNSEMDWDRLLDEKVSSLGGIQRMVVRRILKMMNHFQFLNNWPELCSKGEMEKETLADYNEQSLAKIEDVIKLVTVIGQFEGTFFKDDVLQASVFYRKFLNTEFHGTVRIFERLRSDLIFILLWITVHVVRGDLINFNPILAQVGPSEIDSHIPRLEEELLSINTNYLGLGALKRFSDQLYKDRISFILGTGFQLRVHEESRGIEIAYVDMDENIRNLEAQARKLSGASISDIPIRDLEALDSLFSNLEGFYQSCLRLIAHEDKDIRLPERQREWMKRAQELRDSLRTSFITVIFRPEDVYSDLDLLHRHSPHLLQFLLPEFASFREAELVEETSRKTSLLEHILASVRKIEALIMRDRGKFQDAQLLHQLAQREFGPMAAGIVGLNEFQIETLENMVESLRRKPPLFEALIKSFIFRDLGLLPTLREKYKGCFNTADHAQAGAIFLEKEKIALRYNKDREAERYLVLLVKYHNLLHHMIRGEFSFYALQEVVDLGDEDVLDAVFLSSFIMFYAMGEDLMMEDLATRLFQLRTLCHRIISGETKPEDHLAEVYARKGHLFHALAAYRSKGLPDGVPISRYLELYEWQESKREDYVQSGKIVYALERIFRLRGIRYVEFADLADFMVSVPSMFIYRKRGYAGIGYATFERELYEALRVYNSLVGLSEAVRHFIFQCLVTDEVRIFGFQKVSSHLNYENMAKLLLIGLLGSRELKKQGKPSCIDFLTLAEKIEKRYEAVNDFLGHFSAERIFGASDALAHFFRAKTGITLRKQKTYGVLTIDFIGQVNMDQKVRHMRAIRDVDKLKKYFRLTLQSLRKVPFQTDDYELELEKAFEQSLSELTDLMLDRAKKQMESAKDFSAIYELFMDLAERSLNIGFSDAQRLRLTDLYELTKDNLRREKFMEISHDLEMMQDEGQLRSYWGRVKWYLLNNRPFLGKEFENSIAKKADEAMKRIRERRRG
jgi:hypothetical protein